MCLLNILANIFIPESVSEGFLFSFIFRPGVSSYPWQAIPFTTSSGSWVDAPSTTQSHNDSFDDHGFEATQRLTPKVCTARYCFAIAGSGICPPSACRIRTVRTVIWMCTLVQRNLCVRLLRSSVEIKLLRLSAEISP